jgi:hypothetical protein
MKKYKLTKVEREMSMHINAADRRFVVNTNDWVWERFFRRKGYATDENGRMEIPRENVIVLKNDARKRRQPSLKQLEALAEGRRRRKERLPDRAKEGRGFEARASE